MRFINRQTTNPNRKTLNVTSVNYDPNTGELSSLIVDESNNDGPVIVEGTKLNANNLNPHRAIGAEQVCAYLRGEIDRKTAIENWITKTNQYAKRQRTWFRTQFFADLTIDHIPNNDDLDV